MPAVRIVTDSSCDLPEEVVSELGIVVVPLTIRFGEEEFVDRFQLSASAFYEKMASSADFPATAAPSPGSFQEAFTAQADNGGDTVVCINLSSKLSATMASAQNAAQALEGKLDVRVMDSLSITAGLGSIVRLAAIAAADGRSADEIADLVVDLRSRTRVFGALDTLDNLRKGGRIGGAKAMLGTMLSIKPIIDISSGEVEEAGKQRTRRKAMIWLRDKLAEAGQVENLALCHGDAPDFDDFKALISETHDTADSIDSIIGATIGAHGGPRVLGLAWQDAPAQA